MLRRTAKGSFRDRLRLFAYVWSPLGKGMSEVRLSAFGQDVLFFPGSYYDLEVWRDHFELHDYHGHDEISPRVIFDLGAHVGVSAFYYHLRYPEAEIHCFEPEPSNFEVLKRNVATLPNVHAHQFAITGQDETVRLHRHEKSVSHSLVERSDTGEHVDVQGRSIDSIIRDFGIERVDLIKFNIEGMEKEVFENFRGRHEVASLIGHLHLDLISITRDQFAALFPGHDVAFTATKPHRYRVVAWRRPA